MLGAANIADGGSWLPLLHAHAPTEVVLNNDGTLDEQKFGSYASE